MAAIACKLDGEWPAQKPRYLPRKSDDGKHRLEWVTFENAQGSSHCEPEIRQFGGDSLTRPAELRATWHVPQGPDGDDNITLAFRWAEKALHFEHIAKLGAAAAPNGRANVLVVNIGLHYHAGGEIPCSDYVAAISEALEQLLSTDVFRDSTVLWVEQQTLPPRQSRGFLTSNVSCSPEVRRNATNHIPAVERGRAKLVRTHDVLASHPRFRTATDLHFQFANRFRAEVLLNHLDGL